MRKYWIFAPVSLVAVAALWACANSSRNPNLVVGTDSGGNDSGGGGDTGLLPGDDAGPIPDSGGNACNLGKNANNADPVALCTAEQALQFELQYAYTKGQGLAPGWASTSPYAAVPGHDWHDDLGLAGAMGAYYCSATEYGNTELTPTLSATLNDLSPILVAELKATPPTGYDGEIYFRLRWAQAAFEFANDSGATAMQSMADAFGTSLAAQATAVPASGDGGSAGGWVIGTKNGDGTVTYSPAQAIEAAAALLDMATVHSHDADGGAPLLTWATTAQHVLDYVTARGRDPVTGLFYSSAVTSSDPVHDSPAPGVTTFYTEDQAWAILGLARAQDLLNGLVTASGDAGLFPEGLDASVDVLVYDMAAANVAAAMASAGLFDGNTQPGTPPPVGAAMEGLGAGGVLTNKPTVANAILLGGLHRVATAVGAPTPSYMPGEIRTSLTQFTPANSSLFSIVTDSNGNPVQQAYVTAGSKSYGYAVVYGPDGGDGGLAAGATNYQSAATHAMIEGFNQLWHGAPGDLHCAP